MQQFRLLHKGKNMKIFNYYETLTDDQKEKHKDKKGALLYYEWYSRLYDNVSLEVAGAMLLAVIHYDMYGGAKKLPSKLVKVIKSDKTASILFDTLLERTYAGSKEWINRRGRKSSSKSTTENSTSKTEENAADEADKSSNSGKENQENEEITDEDLPF